MNIKHYKCETKSTKTVKLKTQYLGAKADS